MNDRVEYLEKVVAYYKRMLDFNTKFAIEYNEKGDVERADKFAHNADLFRSRWCVAKKCLAVICDGDFGVFDYIEM